MSQRFLLHVAEVVASGRVARLARAGTAAEAIVVVHAESGPACCARMAATAIHGGSVEQLRLGNVVNRLGKSACPALGNEAAVVARLACRRRDYAVIHGRPDKADLRPMAGIAFGYTSNNRNVSRRFAFCSCAVVTGIAGACTNRIGR